jgi:hypothetical protein
MNYHKALFSSEEYPSLFEEGYLTKTYAKITNRPDLAFTELVANAWDAGAEIVEITIPKLAKDTDMYTSIKDDGVGMSKDDFLFRWRTLAYDRIKHQGEFAEMPFERASQKRRAYGRNGIGRHGMLCFGDKYEVETWQNGHGCKFIITQGSGNSALVIECVKEFKRAGHGTKLTARIDKHYPNISEISEILSVRFMYDPQFKLKINEKKLSLEHFSDVTKEEICISGDLKINITAISSQRTARHSMQHGVAFWVNKRLVGEPSWTLNKRNLADGRTTIARQYTIIVETDDLLSDILEDWTDFKKTDRVESVYEKVEDFANRLFKDVNKDKNEETKQTIIKKFAEDIKTMNYSSKREVLQLVDEIVDESPELSRSYLEVTVAKFVEIKKSRNKSALLERILSLDEHNAEILNKILNDWNISDIECVLDEIDRRLATISAIEKFSIIENMDELHVLHPLILEAKWLFGPEFDSSFYASNKWLATTLREHLKRPECVNQLSNPAKRPDIILFDDGSLIGYGTQEHNSDTGLLEYKKLLIIELKCGGKELTASEIAQTEEYINELFFSNVLNSHVRIDAFTVGDSVSSKISRIKELQDNAGYYYGKIVAATYEQLVVTAKSRLFGLRDHLSERYDLMEPEDLLKRALTEKTGLIALNYIEKHPIRTVSGD